ncbi:MAG: hypothetical protein ACREP5_18165, partial [Candidatus Binatia bacterium]
SLGMSSNGSNRSSRSSRSKRSKLGRIETLLRCVIGTIETFWNEIAFQALPDVFPSKPSLSFSD